LSAYKLTIRKGARVKHERFDRLDDGLDGLERAARAIAVDARREPFGGGVMRRIEPVQQVVGRIELAGPRRLRAGVDVRGDGSAEAFTGRLRRALVEQGAGESPYEALRRAVSARR